MLSSLFLFFARIFKKKQKKKNDFIDIDYTLKEG
jgi:hypothetical protein